MIFWLVAILLFFVLGVAALELLQQDSGYVLISIAGTTVETSFWFALLTIIAVVGVIYAVLFSMKSVSAFLNSSSRSFKEKRLYAVESSYREALLHYFTGNYVEANKLFVTLSKKRDLPIVRALASAHSLVQAAEPTKAFAILDSAEKTYPAERIWLLKAKLVLQSQLNDFENASKTLSILQTLTTNDAIVKQFEIKLLSPEQKRNDVVGLVLRDNRVQRLSAPESNSILIEAFQSIIEKPEENVENVEKLWSKSDRKQKDNAQIQSAYAHALLATHSEEKAKKYIEKTLSKNWNPELVRLYAKVDFGDLDAQLVLAETWQKKYPEEAKLYIALGVLAIKNQYWGKAKSFLNASIEIQESNEAWYLLGDVSEKLGESGVSLSCYKRSAEISS